MVSIWLCHSAGTILIIWQITKAIRTSVPQLCVLMAAPAFNPVRFFPLKGSTMELWKAESTSTANLGTVFSFVLGASAKHQLPQGNGVALPGLRHLPLQRNGRVLCFKAHQPLPRQEEMSSAIQEMQRLLLFLGNKRTGNLGLTKPQYFCTYYTHHCVENFTDFWSYCTF